MSAKDAQKRRSQARAARKRAKSKPAPRRVAVMSVDAFRRVAAPIASEVARKRGVSEDLVEAVMEQMAEDGCLGLDANGQLATMDR